MFYNEKVSMKRKSINKKTLFIPLAILVLVMGGYFGYQQLSANNQKYDAPKPVNTVNYDKPTEEEAKVGDEVKEEIIDEKKKPIVDSSNKQKASVVITDASQYDETIEVRSFIPDYYEDGTCTITFTKGTSSFRKETPAYRDARTTICTNPLIKRSEFPQPGTWTVQVTYESANAKGVSELRNITIN